MSKEKIIHKPANEITSDLRKILIEMESKVTLVMARNARDCDVDWAMPLPTKGGMFNNSSLMYVVYYIDGKPVAYLSYYCDKSDSYDRPSVSFRNIYVDEEFRGRGLGSKMTRYVMKMYPHSYYSFSVIGNNIESLNLLRTLGCDVRKPFMSIYTFHNDYCLSDEEQG